MDAKKRVPLNDVEELRLALWRDGGKVREEWSGGCV